MSFPIQFTIGTLQISLHAILESLGIFIGFRLFLYQRKKAGDVIEQQNRMWIIAAAIFGALVGSRLIGALENPIQWYRSGQPFLYFYQNKTVLGGFLGALAGVELIKKYIGEKRASGDLFVYPIILALIIGRFGCFSMGVYEETYGTASNLPWAMDLGDGAIRHPVTIYEILFLMILWLALKRLSMTVKLENGALFKLFMISYLFFRLLLDFIKPHYTVVMGFSTIQLTSLAGLIYYGAYILKPQKLIAKAYA